MLVSLCENGNDEYVNKSTSTYHTRHLIQRYNKGRHEEADCAWLIVLAPLAER